MEIEYDKTTRTVTISEFPPGTHREVDINGEVFNVDGSEDSFEHTFTEDGLYKLSITPYDLLNDPIETVDEYVLVIEYSKDKLRTLLVSLLDIKTFTGLSSLYIKNNKIIRDIEYSFANSNPTRVNALFKELKWL